MATEITDTTADPARLAHGARTIEELARSHLPESEFWPRFLAALVEATAARSGVIWELGPQGELSPAAGTAGDAPGPAAETGDARLRIQQVLDALRDGRPAIHRPQALHQRAGGAGLVHLVVPLIHGDAGLGAVELFLDDAVPDAAQWDVVPFVEEMGVYAARYFESRREAESVTSHAEFGRRFQAVTLRLHQSLRQQDVAGVAVHEGRTLLGCDRVAVAVRDGSRCIVLAVSGNGRVNPRSNLIRRMADLARCAITAGRPVTYTGTVDELPPVLARAVGDYLAESGARTLQVIPLFEPQRADAPQSPPGERREAFAALLVEQLSDAWLTPTAAERAERFAEHVAAALGNARTHEGLFLLPLWRFLGRALARIGSRRRARAVVGLSLLVGAVIGMALTPWTYRVEGRGRLMPVIQRKVFAATDGEVVELYVRSGAKVAAGQPLVRLRNDDLHARWLAARTELDERQQRRAGLQAELDALVQTTSRDQAIRVRGQLARTAAEIHGLEERLRALDAERELLTVRSPVAGTVATFDLEAVLRDRPVRRGDLLMEVMNEAGAWRLELEIPAHRTGHLLEAQARRETQELPVEFVLATDPGRRCHGHLQAMATRTDLSAQDGLVVKLRASIGEAVPHRRIGAEATAKIDCGQRSLAYVLFGDLAEYVQARLW